MTLKEAVEQQGFNVFALAEMLNSLPVCLNKAEDTSVLYDPSRLTMQEWLKELTREAKPVLKSEEELNQLLLSLGCMALFEVDLCKFEMLNLTNAQDCLSAYEKLTLKEIRDLISKIQS